MKNANASNTGLPRKFICIIFGLFGATSNAQVIYEVTKRPQQMSMLVKLLLGISIIFIIFMFSVLFTRGCSKKIVVASEGEKTSWGGDSGMAQFNVPDGSAFVRDGVPNVADSDNHCIQKTTPPDEPESELENIEKELEEKTQQMNELAQNIHNAIALTATKEDLEKTKQATAQANKELVEAQNALKSERLALGAVLERRKAELQMVNGEIDKMESARADFEAEYIIAEAELHEARRVLDMVTIEKEKYAQKRRLVRAQLSKQQPANEENVHADPLQRVEKKPEMHVDLVEKNSDAEQLQPKAAKAMAYEELPALEKEVKEKEARIEKALGLSKYASARGANTE